ncbi:protein of unknown function [Streptomyces sp. KY70]|nr:protein of unknown function [Streptomyces sp. KY70]
MNIRDRPPPRSVPFFVRDVGTLD